MSEQFIDWKVLCVSLQELHSTELRRVATLQARVRKLTAGHGRILRIAPRNGEDCSYLYSKEALEDYPEGEST